MRGLWRGGLDYHYNHAPKDTAARVFRNHIAAARIAGLPLVIHTRDADDDCAAILRDEMGKGAFTALLHCFTASQALAETAVELGLYISFSGVVTFKNSQSLRDTASTVPLERMLVETDAPFLAPTPHRGKRNEPAYVADTARVLAQVKGMSEADFAGATTANALRLFSKMPPLRQRKWRRDANSHHPWLQLLRRRAARRAGLGQMQSRQSEEPPPPLLDPYFARRGGRLNQYSRRHVP